LLEKSTEKQVNFTSLKLNHTPLMVASYYGNEKTIKILLDSKKCDVSLRDSCGDFALHHAIKQSRTSCVKLLISHAKKIGGGSLKSFSLEDGVGLTSLDSAMLKMQNQLVVNRGGYSYGNTNVSVFLTKEQNSIFKLAFDSKEKREIVSSDYTRQVTDILLDQVNEDGLTEMGAVPNVHLTRFAKPADQIDDEKDDMVESDDGKKDDKKDDKKYDEDEEEEADSLKGLVIAITGSLSKPRKQFEALIKKNGGKFSASISNSVTHLVCDDVNSDTSKVTKAKEQGIKVVTEKFLAKFL